MERTYIAQALTMAGQIQYAPMHTILKHPLVDHRLSYMRDRATAPKLFRELVSDRHS